MASTLIVDQIQKTGGSTTALTLPTSNASASQYLQNDGAGALSWATVASAGFIKYTVVTASDSTFDLQSTTTKVVLEVQASVDPVMPVNSFLAYAPPPPLPPLYPEL